MYDVQPALNDLASQLRACRARDGLTLQQLATRCGVAASTIHKIESQQMVPTVSVLLKIARGLGRRPEELVRDRWSEGQGSTPDRGDSTSATALADTALAYDRSSAAWRVDFAKGEQLMPCVLDPEQRLILFVERGVGELACHSQRVRLVAGECLELVGEQFGFSSDESAPAQVLVIASPAGHLVRAFGPPNAAGHPPPPTRSVASDPGAPIAAAAGAH